MKASGTTAGTTTATANGGAGRSMDTQRQQRRNSSRDTASFRMNRRSSGASGSAKAMLRSSIPGGTVVGSATRRRSSASEITFSARSLLGVAGAAGDGGRGGGGQVGVVPDDAMPRSLFCPLPKSKRGFFYSRAWKEHKQKRKKDRLRMNGSSDGDGGGSSVDDDIPVLRDLTRRKRNSFHKDAHGGAGSRVAFEPTNVTAYLAARVESEKPEVSDAAGHSHSAALLGGSAKGHMMDVSLVGKDGVEVRAARFILACHSSVLEEVFFKGRKCPEYDPERAVLRADYCDEAVLRAAAHHCFGGEVPEGFSLTDPSEGVARRLAQLDHFSRVYKFSALGEVTYRALRKLINRRPVLACAIFDELSIQEGAGAVDGIKRYALDCMREMPMDTLLGGGVQWMKEDSVEAIMQDQDMDVDEFYMFKILNAWAIKKGEDHEARLPVAQRLSKHIELKFIDPALLQDQVRASGYFAERQIVEAVKLIEDSLANRDPCEMERVLVEGAGCEIVNGIYCRVEEEVGMGEEEILFVKEAEDGYSDVGLYLWGTKWNIAMCADYSNCFYSCEDPPNKSSTELVPGGNWGVQYGGKDPPPYCTYLPNTRSSRVAGTGSGGGKALLAPNLEEMMDPTIAEKRRSGYFDKRNDDVIEKRTMTLEQMMNLPEDKGI
ncbi:hypothetical protein ACHAWF_007150 [Thalassiosira exigua]